MKIETPTASLNALHALLDGRGKTRKIERTILANLLIDHQRMAAKLRAEGVKI